MECVEDILFAESDCQEELTAAYVAQRLERRELGIRDVAVGLFIDDVGEIG